MSSSAPVLSTELILRILLYTHPTTSTLSTYALISKSFSLACASLLYHTVTPSSLPSSSLPHNASFVHSLSLSGFILSQLAARLPTLLPSFTNLRTLTLAPEAGFASSRSLLSPCIPVLHDLPGLKVLTVAAPQVLSGDDAKVFLAAPLEHLESLTVTSPTRAVLEGLGAWLATLPRLRALHLLEDCGSVTPGVLRSLLPTSYVQSTSIPAPTSFSQPPPFEEDYDPPIEDDYPQYDTDHQFHDHYVYDDDQHRPHEYVDHDPTQNDTPHDSISAVKSVLSEPTSASEPETPGPKLESALPDLTTAAHGRPAPGPAAPVTIPEPSEAGPSPERAPSPTPSPAPAPELPSLSSPTAEPAPAPALKLTSFSLGLSYSLTDDDVFEFVQHLGETLEHLELRYYYQLTPPRRVPYPSLPHLKSFIGRYSATRSDPRGALQTRREVDALDRWVRRVLWGVGQLEGVGVLEEGERPVMGNGRRWWGDEAECCADMKFGEVQGDEEDKAGIIILRSLGGVPRVSDPDSGRNPNPEYTPTYTADPRPAARSHHKSKSRPNGPPTPAHKALLAHLLAKHARTLCVLDLGRGCAGVKGVRELRASVGAREGDKRLVLRARDAR